MTVLDNTPRDQYTASGGQVAFTYTFEIAAEGDIAVLQNGTLLNLGAGAGEYAVTGAGVDTGGVVTLVTAATAGDIITLYRDMALDRLTSYTNGGDFLAADVNNDFDRLWLALQQNTGVSDRALVAPNTDPTNINMTIPDKATRLNKFLKFNENTGNPEVSDATGLYVSAGMHVYNFTGDGTTVNFTLGMDPGGENNTQVYIDGVYQQKDGYNVSGSIVQFSVAPPNLSTIEVMVIEALPVGATTASQVSFTQAGSTYGRNVQLKLQESVSVKDFGAVGDGVTDDTAAMQAFRDHIAATLALGIFPSGTYKYTASPNWAIENATILAEGKVILDYTGTGKAIVIDADASGAVSATAGLVYNLTFRGFSVQAPSAATDGLYLESIHHSNIEINFLGGCTSGIAFNIGFSVVTEFRLTASVNVGGWSAGGKPTYGIKLRKRGAGETPSYNVFINTIIEGPIVGIWNFQSLGCLFLGGTSEACSDTGLLSATGAIENKYYGLDFEANTGADIVDGGKRNSYLNCDTTNLVRFDSGSLSCSLQDGSHSNVSVVSGALNTKLSDFEYSRAGFAGSLTVSEITTRMSNLFNGTTSLHHDMLPTSTAIVVGASPFTYTNTSANNIIVTVAVGTVSTISIYHTAVTSDLGVTAGQFMLYPNDGLTVTYSGVPTMRRLTG